MAITYVRHTRCMVRLLQRFFPDEWHDRLLMLWETFSYEFEDELGLSGLKHCIQMMFYVYLESFEARSDVPTECEAIKHFIAIMYLAMKSESDDEIPRKFVKRVLCDVADDDLRVIIDEWFEQSRALEIIYLQMIKYRTWLTPKIWSNYESIWERYIEYDAPSMKRSIDVVNLKCRIPFICGSPTPKRIKISV